MSTVLSSKRLPRRAATFFLQALSLAALLFFTNVSFGQVRLVGLTSSGGPNNGGTAFNILSNGTGFAVSQAFTASGGSNPPGNLVQGNDGNFYGMTASGGINSDGTIFKMTSAGQITILKNFNGTIGAAPYGSLIKGTDGNFYGMAYGGGTIGYGTIFKMTSAGITTVLKNLSYDTTGVMPHGNLVQASDGNFYGMTSGDNQYNYGTIFKITATGTFTLLKSCDNTTGSNPQGSLVQGSDGALYGMAAQGGTYGEGVIFKINMSGAGYTILKNFDGTSGAYPLGSLVKGTDGNFYGMTSQGGTNGSGVIFKLTPAGAYTIIKNLDNTTGSYPNGSLVQGKDGLLYGMTANSGANNAGTIFKITTSGTLTVLKSFSNTSSSGATPYGDLMQASDGNFYGMTYGGGIDQRGTVFKISSSGSYKLLTSFPDNGWGYSARGLVQASDGNFYGLAPYGGANSNGTAFKLCPSGSFTTLRAFSSSTTGGSPYGSLVQGKDGYLYGMTYSGGTIGLGTIFKMTTSGTITVLKNLDGTNTGDNPSGSLVAGNDTTFYGMTNSGGTIGYGTIFKITTKGAFTVLKNLDNTTGGQPLGSLVKGTDGNFYGMTNGGGSNGYGTIFKMTPTGTLTVLKNFDYSTTGGEPTGSLIQGSDGYFYGITPHGGTNDYGTIFKINSTGSTFTVLKNLDYWTTGAYPEDHLVQGSDSTLYGVALAGGTYLGGTIFKIKPNGGSFTVLHHFNPSTDGSAPYGSLVIQQPNPVATPVTTTTVENTAKKVKLLATGGTPLSYSVSTAPKNGTATIKADTLTYTPKANYVGTDSVYYTATWGCQKSSAVKIKITITATAVTMTQEDSKGLAREEATKLSVTALPNPSATSFTLNVRSGTVAPVTVRVVNSFGQVVERWSGVPYSGTLQIGSNYKPGLYIAEVQQGSERVVLKLLKQ